MRAAHGTRRKHAHDTCATQTGVDVIGDSADIGDLGEFGVIARLAARAAARQPPGGGPLLGSGDDAAVVAAPDGRVVATTDFLLEGRHFRTDWSRPTEVGHRAAVRSLADVAAMGAVPTALLVAFAAPAGLPASWAVDVADGLATEAARAGASVVGGDMAAADSVLLAVTGLGDLQGRKPVTRSGARAGDVLAVAGQLGCSAAGYALLAADVAGATTGSAPPAAGSARPAAGAARPAAGAAEPVTGAASATTGPARPGDRAVRALVAAHLRPLPPYPAGPQAAAAGATSMIDVSDGLVADLGHVAAASGVLIDFRLADLRRATPGVAADLDAAAAVLGDPSLPARWLLTGGEDHSLAATFPPGASPPGWHVIGLVRPGHGVLVDGEPYRGRAGWDHFGGPAAG